MQPLSATLEAMKSPEDLQKALSRGSTQSGGLTIIEARPKPLTENDLTAIASKLLLKSPSVSWTKRKIYGTRSSSDEIIGEEDGVEIEILYRGGMSRQLLEATLRPSPQAATMDHLKRLARHKRLGSSDKDRAVLLHDYASALANYSDFVVYLACKTLWEDSAKEFYPKIKTIREVCETFHLAFTGLMGRLSDQKALVAAPPPKRVLVEESESGKFLRRQLCDFLITKGKPDYFDKIRLHSNYFLEMEARHHGWGNADGGSVAPPDASATHAAENKPDVPVAS